MLHADSLALIPSGRVWNGAAFQSVTRRARPQYEAVWLHRYRIPAYKTRRLRIASIRSVYIKQNADVCRFGLTLSW